VDGIHDLGGKHGYGPIIREDNEPAFHARWEASVFTMLRAAAGAGAYNNTDRFRHAIERIDPVSYLADTYYGRWLGGLETLLVEAGVLTIEAVNQRILERGGEPTRIAARPMRPPDPPGENTDNRTASRPLSGAPAFAEGDVVVTRIDVNSGHTRLPAYARGKRGRILRCHGGWVYPDTNAHGLGEDPQFLYTVEFDSRVLWGAGAEPGVKVYLDLFEPYLEVTA